MSHTILCLYRHHSNSGHWTVTRCEGTMSERTSIRVLNLLLLRQLFEGDTISQVLNPGQIWVNKNKK